MSVRRHDGSPAFPGWGGLLEHAAVRLVEEHSLAASDVRQKLAAGDLLTAASIARDALGPLWTDFLRTEFEVPRTTVLEHSLQLPKLLWALRSDLVVTTNYDRVLEWACPSHANLQRWGIQAPAGLVAVMRGRLNAPAVWHLHGHVDHLDDVILTPDGYTKLYSAPNGSTAYEAALIALRSLITTRTFLFVGFSFADRALSRQFEWAHEVFSGNAGPHYLLVAEADKDDARLNTHGLPIEVLTYEPDRLPLEELLQAFADVAGGKPVPWRWEFSHLGRARLQEASQDLLLWSDDGGVEKTLRLRPMRDTMEIIGSCPNIVTMAGARPWVFRRSKRPLGPGARDIDGSVLESLDDAALVSVLDNDSLSATSALPFPGAGGDEFERRVDLVFALGHFVSTAQEDGVWGGAHPNRHCWAQIIDLESRRRAEVFTAGEMGSILRNERAEALRQFCAEGYGLGDETLDSFELVLVHPKYDQHGTLSLRLQFAGPTAYTGSDGNWSSYTKSCFVYAHRTPLALSPYSRVPPHLLAFLTERGFPQRFGWSRVRPTFPTLQWLDCAFTGPEAA